NITQTHKHTMSLVTPFIPTAEELAEVARMHPQLAATAGTASATHGAAAQPATSAQGPSHTHSTGLPALNALPQAQPGTAWGAPAPLQAAPGQQQTPPPRPPLAQFVLTAEQLAALVIPPRPALLDQWLCQGDLGYIYAPRGVGKTWMAMALPGAISCRRPLGLWAAAAPETPAPTPDEVPASEATPVPAPAPAPDHIPVLYVDGEMALKHTQYRAHGLDLSKVHHLHHEHLFNQNGTCLNIGEVEDRQRLTDLIIQLGYQVIILDNLSSLASGVDENKGMDYEPLSHWLLELRRRKITVIVVHHAGRNGLMRGHSKREDACSWIIELRDARLESDPGAKFVSHFAKPSRNTGDPLPDMLWHFTTDKTTGITDIQCELSINSEYDQFVQHVCEGVTNQNDIAEMMGKNRGTVSKWATRALQEGRVSGSPRKLQPPKSHANKVCAKAYADDDDYEAEDD
ncbi:MAG: AAA family ATPase, partial [Prosthecobacter sp.]